MKRITARVVVVILGITMLSSCGIFELFAGATIGRIIKGGDWIYYTNLKEDALYKIKTDFTEKTRVSTGLDFMVIQGGDIFFIDAERGISRIGTDGSGYDKIVDIDEGWFGFCVSGDWIYYGTKSGNLYKIRTDGEEKTKITGTGSFSGEMMV